MLEDKKNYVVFDGKKLSDIFKDIYSNNENLKKQIKDLIDRISGKITSMNDVAILAPILKDYLDVTVKSDDQIVKVADIVQRMIKGDNVTGNDSILSEDERRQLLEEVRSGKHQSKREASLDILNKKTKKILESN